MDQVVLIIHLMLALGIIGLVLLQRSEGGGLGIGGGGGGIGGLASAGQTANVLTRTTAFLAAGFFCTSLLLAVLAGQTSNATSLLESLDNVPPAVDTPAQTSDNELPDAPATGSETQATENNAQDVENQGENQSSSSVPSAPLSE
jgi:preprotein translocase subunit SecG